MLLGLPSTPSCNVLHLIDFGLAKRYTDATGEVHINPREGKALTGTARYVSLATHAGFEQARRDDVESLFYFLAYLLRGTLPWQGLHAPTKEAKCEAPCADISLRPSLPPTPPRAQIARFGRRS